jgi:methyl-accepting chemotaxis protein
MYSRLRAGSRSPLAPSGISFVKFLGHLRLRAKLTLLLGLSALGLILSIGAGAFQMHQRMVDDRVDKLRAVVQSAIAFAHSLESRVVARQLTREQAMALLRDDIHAIRFDAGAGYVSVQGEDANGRVIVLAHGIDPRREDKPSDTKDSEGRPISDLITEVLNGHDNGIVRYLFPKPGQTVPLLKLSYVARFDPWKAAFYAGAYIDDLDADFRATLSRLVMIGGSILLMTLLSGWLINRDITRSLDRLRDAMGRLAHGSQIETVRSATADAVAAMTEIGTIIARMDEVSAAIAAAVEQQSASTRDIAGSVQAVSGATRASASAMEHVVGVADGAGDAGRDVLAASDEIGREAATLRTEVDQFLTVVRDDGDSSGDRRRYERIDAKGVVATLRAAGRTAEVGVREIARGGALLASDWALAAGTPFELELRGAGGVLMGRVVRSDKGALAVVFSLDPAALACIDRLLDSLAPRRTVA